MIPCCDEKPCKTWQSHDSLICRHGVCHQFKDSGGGYFECPADLMYDAEKEKWAQFFEMLPDIIKRVQSSLEGEGKR